MGPKNRESLETGIQRRLNHFVDQYHAAYPSSVNTPFNEEFFLAYVFARDPSFKRKPEKLLFKLLDRILNEREGNSSNNNNNSNQKKRNVSRKHSSNSQYNNRDEDDNNDDDGDNSDSSFEIDPNVNLVQVKETNFLNRSLVKVYQPEAVNINVSEEKKAESNSFSSSITNNTNDSVTTQNHQGNSSIQHSETNSTNDNYSNIENNNTSCTIKDVKRKRTKQDSSDNKKTKTGKSSNSALVVTKSKLSDLGGIDNCIEEILQLIGMPLKHPEIYIHLGIQPPRGILLHGPPGCGKTMLAHAIAGECNVPFLNISAPSIVSGMSGESEKKLREVFEEAKDLAPCILFIDEIDAITPKRETAQREMERRIVAQFLTCMDDISMEKTNNRPVILIGATNRPDSLDPALRRAGRFDREISLGVPDETARKNILEKISSKLRLSGSFDFDTLAKKTPGYVGADLNALMSEAGMIAVKRILNELVDASIQNHLINSHKTTVEERDEQFLNNINHHQHDDKMTTPLLEFIPEEEKGKQNDMEIDDHTASDKIEVPIENGIRSSTINPLKQNNNDNSLKLNNADTIMNILQQPSFSSQNLQKVSYFLSHRSEPLSEQELSSVCIDNEDFLQALKKVQPSSKREGFATVPDVSWDDIGALKTVRQELRMAVIEPVKYPEYFQRVGILSPVSVLLYGPPGCGKTLLAKAVANESHCNFISVKGPELLNKYVGESERSIRQVFTRAAASSPCIIFFDELDAICPSRSNDSESQHASRLVNTLLTEMDGMQGRSQVYVIAATNRPDMIDPAMLRPGRLDKALYVDLPCAEERFEILKTVSRKLPLHVSVDLYQLACDARCEGLSGADLASLVREAGVAALKGSLHVSEDGIQIHEKRIDPNEIYVSMHHFDMALRNMTPSVSLKDRKRYELLKVKFSGGGGHQQLPSTSTKEE